MTLDQIQKEQYTPLKCYLCGYESHTMLQLLNGKFVCIRCERIFPHKI
jgi:formylmethanofuran dehydrogenase subunit E